MAAAAAAVPTVAWDRHDAIYLVLPGAPETHVIGAHINDKGEVHVLLWHVFSEKDEAKHAIEEAGLLTHMKHEHKNGDIVALVENNYCGTSHGERYVARLRACQDVKTAAAVCVNAVTPARHVAAQDLRQRGMVHACQLIRDGQPSLAGVLERADLEQLELRELAARRVLNDAIYHLTHGYTPV